MATEFSQDEVLRFLCRKSGKVKNADLLVHFRQFLREDENRAQNRELFKRFVNSVAVVKQEEGVSCIVLRKKYLGLAQYVGDTPSLETSGEKTSNQRPKEVSVKVDVRNTPEKGQATDFKVKGKEPSHHASFIKLQDPDNVLLAAGIAKNNTEIVKTLPIENTTNILPPHTAEQSRLPETVVGTDNRSCTLKPSPLHLQPELNKSGESCQQVLTCTVAAEAVFHSSQSPVQTGDEKESLVAAEERLSKELQIQKKSFSSSSYCHYNESKPPVPEIFIGNNVLRRLSDESEQKTVESVCVVQMLNASQGSNPRISSSTPCLLDCAEVSDTLPDYHLVTRSNGSLPRSKDRHTRQSEDSNGEPTLFDPQSVRHSLPLQNARSHSPTGFAEHHRIGLSTSHGNLLMPSYRDREWALDSPKEEWSSDDSLNYKELSCEQGVKVREMLRRAQEARLLSQLHRAERKVTPLHHSTGNLDDQEPEAVPESSVLSTAVPLRPGARRTRSQLRSRMCRSLGADLDQPFFEDGVSARLNRLQLLSSSLSINYSTSSRATSYGDVSSPDVPSGRMQSLNNGSSVHRSSMVPLEPKEHDWLVKAAAGTWPDIYSLFREEPSLLNKRDFISGYTVLHWIAKHGDHRVLNTLWYGVNKMGMKLDVDTTTTCGYTPLHLAAIHGHKKLIRLLVHKFKANVALRDTSGKKPWQYIGRAGPRDLLQLLGAPLSITGVRAAQEPPSSEKLMTRPVTMSPKVKRHSSIAAFLKHKSLMRIPGNSESFV